MQRKTLLNYGFAVLALASLASCADHAFSKKINFPDQRWEVNSISEVSTELASLQTISTVGLVVHYLHGTQITQFDLNIEVDLDGKIMSFNQAIDLTQNAECLGDLCDFKLALPLANAVEAKNIKVKVVPQFKGSSYLPNIQAVTVNVE